VRGFETVLYLIIGVLTLLVGVVGVWLANGAAPGPAALRRFRSRRR